MIFLSLMVSSVAPVSGLYKWMEHSAIQKEISYVDENHLIIAQSLAHALNRYASDVMSVFEFASAVPEGLNELKIGELFDDFDLRFAILIDENDEVVKAIKAAGSTTVQSLASDQILTLRAVAASRPGQSVFSGVLQFDGAPHLFLVRSNPDDTLAVGALKLGYLIMLQRSIQFGERGHAMIVDQNGLVIAHPNPEWQASSKDASALSVVQQMIAGQTGVATFFSPPMQADMISGFTVVDRTGWGVMVPQPMSELIAKAKATERTALSIVLVEVMLIILFSAWLSRLISNPIRDVVKAAKAVSAGDLTARVETSAERVMISEAELLGESFNQVIGDLQTERNDLADALVTAQEGARAKARFLSVMSHEIRTPMHGIVGVLELIQDGKLDQDRRQLVAVGQKAARNMVRVLDSVLSYVKLGSQTEGSEITTFNAADLVQSTVDLFYPLASQKGVRLTADVAGQILKGDPQMMGQILSNLVGNAIKFTDEGDIRITAEIQHENTGEERFILSVTDSGIGIEKHLHTTIFDEFTQVGSRLTRTHEGSGLGLAIAAHLAHLMKGEITLTSEPNRGSCFRLNIPVNASEV
jgi:signal transduction histidine kinase